MGRGAAPIGGGRTQAKGIIVSSLAARLLARPAHRPLLVSAHLGAARACARRIDYRST